MNQELSFLVRLAIAVLCGALIGFERSRRQKEAGIRTHIMVTLGATLIVIVSKYGFLDVAGAPGINVDISRIAANVVTGISFLGAGVIFLRGGSVKGLTTAAGIWSTAGVGCAIGAGMYEIGIVATLMIIIIQTILHLFVPSSENMPVMELSFKLLHINNSFEKLKKHLNNMNVMIQQINVIKNIDDTITVDMILKVPKNVSFDSIIAVMDSNPDVMEFSAQN